MRILRATLICVAGICLLPATSGSAWTEDYPPASGQSADVRFPTLGAVHVSAEVRPGMLPAIVFTKVGTKPDLLRLEVGAGDLDRKLINDGRPYPIIRFDVLHFPNIPSPIIFAAAMEPGGSDCSYVAAVVGEREGKITPLAPKLPLVNAEGGYGIESSKPDGLELLTWNFIWGAGESHVDPHDYWVQVYRFDAGRFVFSRRYIVKKNQPKISFPNLLRRLKDFGC